jgi:hypothetical protein
MDNPVFHKFLLIWVFRSIGDMYTVLCDSAIL